MMLKFRYKIKEFTGNIAFAERYLGSGGTTTLIVLLALLLFFGSIAYVTGAIEGFINTFLGGLFGV